jgi:hypothetical protein
MLHTNATLPYPTAISQIISPPLRGEDGRQIKISKLSREECQFLGKYQVLEQLPPPSPFLKREIPISFRGDALIYAGIKSRGFD